MSVQVSLFNVPYNLASTSDVDKTEYSSLSSVYNKFNSIILHCIILSSFEGILQYTTYK